MPRCCSSSSSCARSVSVNRETSPGQPIQRPFEDRCQGLSPVARPPSAVDRRTTPSLSAALTGSRFDTMSKQPGVDIILTSNYYDEQCVTMTKEAA